MRRVLAMATILAAIATGASAAEASTSHTDLKCVLAFRALAMSPQYRDFANMGLFYYVGRIEGREPDLDLGLALKHMKSDMQDSDYPREIQRCSKAMQAENEGLKAMSRGLQPLSGRGG